ncbi:uncharacterized protein LOC113004981 [Solenopsis invicta]|uniref:uncharacterized protein LOC113004981 n=1 Tax=Solenopsis invicta TaxID=13686 RepID=UPI00193CB9DC|nr:uncharacterized protein LOC113004981 [Solenopsis invicta]
MVSKTEEATLNLISPICIDGHTEVKESEVQIESDTEINFETDEVEYLDEDIKDLKQIGINSAVCFNMGNAETKDYNKENTLIDNAAGNSDENGNSNDSSTTPITKKRKRMSLSQKFQATQQPTQDLANIAQKTYDMQNTYYENKLLLRKQKLKLKERLVSAVEKCNPS